MLGSMWEGGHPGINAGGGVTLGSMWEGGHAGIIVEGSHSDDKMQSNVHCPPKDETILIS